MEFVAKIISILCRTESEIRCLRELSCTSHFTPFPSCNTAYLYRFGIHKKRFSPPPIISAIRLRICLHNPAVCFRRSLNCLRDMRLGILSWYSLSFDSKSQFSLSILSDSAARDNATTSKSENLEIGPRRGMFPFHSQVYQKAACISQEFWRILYISCAYGDLYLIVWPLLNYQNQRYAQLFRHKYSLNLIPPTGKLYVVMHDFKRKQY